MDFSQLEAFRVIAETGSLTKAAEQLHVTQPAMSAALKKLETELGVELFDRSPNRISLNKTGEIALIHVQALLRGAAQMRADLLSAAQRELSLSIAFCDPGVRWFSVPRFSVAHPDVRVEDDLYEGEEAAKLLAERVYDLVVTARPVEDSRVRCLPFLQDQVYLSVPDDSPLLKRESVSLKDIPAQPLLYPQIGGYFLAQMEAVIQRDGLPLTLVKNNFNVTQHLIRTTNFLATVSALSQDLRNDGDHRARIPLADPEMEVQYYLSYAKANQRKVQCFVEWARAVRRENGGVPAPSA